MSPARGGFRARRRGSGEHVVRETRRWDEGVTGAYLSLSVSRDAFSTRDDDDDDDDDYTRDVSRRARID
jgi:hypothetical protein